MVSGDIGLPSKPQQFHGEQLVFEERTTDPASTSKGEMWLRTDLAPKTNQLATLRFDNGSGTWDIPVFQAGTSDANVEEVLRIPVGGVVGYVPILADTPPYTPAFPQLGFQHAGARYGLHNLVSAIPDSAVHQWPLDEGSGTSVADAIGSNTGTINGATWDAVNDADGGYELSFDGTDDRLDFQSQATNVSGGGSHSFAVTITLDGLNDQVILDHTNSSSDRTEIKVYGGEWRVEEYAGSWNSVGWSGVSSGTRYRIVSIWDSGPSAIYANNTQVNDTTPIGGKISGPEVGHAIGTAVSGAFYMGGDIDNPIWYDSALSASQVSDDYNAQPWS